MSRHVLFLCTGNSARSLIAECLLRDLGGDRFRAFSAGSHPTGAPNPHALRLLRERGHDVGGLRSKSWDEFAAPGAPELHLVLTVCDAARGESCPVWPGRPATAHWGLPDPAAARGSDEQVQAAFRDTYDALASRVRRLLALPLDELDPSTLRARLSDIGADSSS